jgi:hypothetical protein
MHVTAQAGWNCDPYGNCNSWKRGFAGDGGPANTAKLNNPQGLALAGRLLFVADMGNCRCVRAMHAVAAVRGTNGSAAQACMLKRMHTCPTHGRAGCRSHGCCVCITHVGG